MLLHARLAAQCLTPKALRYLRRVGHATLKRAEKDKRKRTREEIVDAIDQGFEAAKEIPVHPTDPSLKPLEVLPAWFCMCVCGVWWCVPRAPTNRMCVCNTFLPPQILPVFPDHDLWANSYTLVTFDADPGRPRSQKQALIKVPLFIIIIIIYG